MQSVALWMNTVAISWAKRALLACALLLGAAGVASADDIAFGFTYSGDRVGTIDLNTGSFTPLAAQPTAYAGIGMTGGNVYAAQYSCLFCGGTPSPFYQIDTTTGAATLLGNSDAVFAMGSTSSGGLVRLGPLWLPGDSQPSKRRFHSDRVHVLHLWLR